MSAPRGGPPISLKTLVTALIGLAGRVAAWHAWGTFTITFQDGQIAAVGWNQTVVNDDQLARLAVQNQPAKLPEPAGQPVHSPAAV